MSYWEGSNWQAKKEDEGKPLFENEKHSPIEPSQSAKIEAKRNYVAVSPFNFPLVDGWYKDAKGNDFQLIKVSEPSQQKDEGLPDQKEGKNYVESLRRIERLCLKDCVGIEQMQKDFKSIYEIVNEALSSPPEPSSKEQEGDAMLKSAMDKFGEAHTLLAKTGLKHDQYQPISSLLAEAKVELFNFYQLYKKKP